jgi:hypothetical protein
MKCRPVASNSKLQYGLLARLTGIPEAELVRGLASGAVLELAAMVFFVALQLAGVRQHMDKATAKEADLDKLQANMATQRRARELEYTARDRDEKLCQYRASSKGMDPLADRIADLTFGLATPDQVSGWWPIILGGVAELAALLGPFALVAALL